MTRPEAMRRRLDAVRDRMATAAAAVAVFGLSSNLRYLVGFCDEPGERMLLLVVPREGEAAFIVPELYADQVASHEPPAALHVWADGDDPGALLRDVAAEHAGIPGAVLLDDSLWATFALSVQRAYAGRSFGLASDVLGPLRVRKDDEEIAAMKRAGSIADRAYDVVTSEAIVGRTEIELAGRLESAMLAAGADGIAFETLVASGPNSALPHYRAGTRRIASGDVVILDYGCRVDGYCSDISRTLACGAPTADVERVYAAVREAHRAARSRAEIGATAEAVDEAARGVLTDAGFGERFVHRTGHGIGLDVHEPPYIVSGNGLRLERGMAFSIEPGAYFAGRFGVRVEDVVILGEGGAVPMTEAPRELKRVA